MKKNWYLLIILGVILFIMWWYLAPNNNENKTSDLDLVKDTVEQEKEYVEMENDDNTESIELFSVGEFTGSATAMRNFDGTTFVHVVTAQLPDPAQGKFYEGWLVKKAPTLMFVSTGKLEKDGGMYSLTFSENMDYTEYVDVVITEETENLGLDNKPEAHVLEGTFKSL